MKKIGFIDYFIDEWHANNYPRMIRESSFKDRFEVALAWEEIVQPGKKPIDEWCRDQKVVRAATVRQVVKECDCLIVLSPDNAERHEDLAKLPLQSGKPVYIDKPIAPSLRIAKRLFARARKHATPMMSCSALRYGSALEDLLKDPIGQKPVRFVATRGGGVFQIYAIHQVEMLVMTLGTGATRVMQCGNAQAQVMVVDYPDGRRGQITLAPGQGFQLSVAFGDKEGFVIDKMDDFFPRFIEAMLRFFDTGQPLVPEAQTLEIAALVEAGTKALAKPDKWVKVPR